MEARYVPWFKVDDRLHGHKKVRKAVRLDPRAMSLWVIAGSWCADQLTDGFVPAYVAESLVADAMEIAEVLVTVGLWEPADRDGDDGWQFHDWSELQPQARDVLTARESDRQRKRDWRERKRRERMSPRDVRDGPPGVPDMSQTGTWASRVSKRAHEPDPTRPDPTPVPNGTGRGGGGASEAPEIEIPIPTKAGERADEVEEAMADLRKRLPKGRPLSRYAKGPDAE